MCLYGVTIELHTHPDGLNGVGIEAISPRISPYEEVVSRHTGSCSMREGIKHLGSAGEVTIKFPFSKDIRHDM